MAAKATPILEAGVPPRPCGSRKKSLRGSIGNRGAPSLRSHTLVEAIGKAVSMRTRLFPLLGLAFAEPGRSRCQLTEPERAQRRHSWSARQPHPAARKNKQRRNPERAPAASSPNLNDSAPWHPGGRCSLTRSFPISYK